MTALQSLHDVAGEAEALGREADARWNELDAACRLPADLDEAVRRSGLLRSLVPAGLGGPGTTPLEWFRTGVELARHEPSLGWVVTQGAAELGWIAAAGDPAWAAEVLGDPLAASASSTAGLGTLVVGDGSARLGGRWSFNTGSPGATWIGGLAMVDGELPGVPPADDGLPGMRIGWVPAERAQVLDDWDPSGLRGTGSNGTVIPDQDVDPRWTLTPFAPTALDRGPHRVLVGNGNWPIAASVAATQLGAARRALDEAAAIVVDKVSMPDRDVLATRTSVQRLLSHAEGLWLAGLAAVEHQLEAMWDEAVLYGELGVERRLSLFWANASASALAAEIVDAACEATGTTGLVRSHPIGRMRRDVQALRGHLATNGAAVEMAGRVRLGLAEPDIRI